MQTEKRPTDPVRDQLHVLGKELETLKGDLKVQARLATMELRDRWNRIEKRHTELHESVRSAGHDAMDLLRRSVSELRSDVDKLRDDAGIDPEC